MGKMVGCREPLLFGFVKKCGAHLHHLLAVALHVHPYAVVFVQSNH